MQKQQTKALVKDVTIGAAGYVIGTILVFAVKKIATKIKVKKAVASTTFAEIPSVSDLESAAV